MFPRRWRQWAMLLRGRRGSREFTACRVAGQRRRAMPSAPEAARERPGAPIHTVCAFVEPSLWEVERGECKSLGEGKRGEGGHGEAEGQNYEGDHVWQEGGHHVGRLSWWALHRGGLSCSCAGRISRGRGQQWMAEGGTIITRCKRARVRRA